MSNVGFATLQIIPSARGFGAALGKETNAPLAASGREGGKRYGTLWASAAMSPLRAVGAAAVGLFAVDKAKDFLKDAVSEASDLHEAGSALDQVFGKASGTIVKFAQGSATTLGQSTLQTEQAATTFGVYGKAAGLAGDANAKFSSGMVGLSGDLASFYNTSPEDAIEAIGAGLRGEAEPLRKYGILLDDATLRQEAMRQGLIKNTKTALTPQQRVLAAHAVILRQSKVAQGDFARTSGGLANQQRILSAQFTNMKGAVGKALLPAITMALTAMNGLFKYVPRVATAVQGFFRSLSGGSTGAQASAVFAQVRSVVETFAKTLTTTVIPMVVSFVTQMRASLFPVFQQIVSIIVTQVIPIVASLARYFYGTLAPAILKIVASIAGSLKPVLDQLVATFQARILPSLTLVLAHFREWAPTLQRVATVVLTVVGALLRFTAYVLGKVLPVVIRLAGFLIGTLVRAIVAVVTAAVKIVGAMVSVGAAFGRAVAAAGRFVAGITSKMASAVSYVAGIPGKIVHALGNLGSLLLSAGGDVISGFVRGIESGASSIISAIKSTITDKLPGFVKKALGIHSPSRVFRQIGRFVVDGLNAGIKDKDGEVDKVLRDLSRKLRDAGKSKLANALRDETKKLNALATQRVAVAKKLAGAEKSLAALQKKATDYAAQTRDAVLSTGDVTSFGSSFDGIIAGLTDSVAKAKQFAATIAQLKKAGLNSTSLAQIVASGSTQGLATGQAILEQVGGVAQVNSLEKQLGTAAKSVGATASSALYGAGLDAAEGLVKGLKAKEKALTAQMRRIADSLVAQVKKRLGIHSPSRVFAELGGHVATGMAQGIERNTHRVTAATKTLVNVPDVPAAGRGGANGSSSASPTPVRVPIVLDGRVLAEAVFEIGGTEYGYGRKG